MKRNTFIYYDLVIIMIVGFCTCCQKSEINAESPKMTHLSTYSYITELNKTKRKKRDILGAALLGGLAFAGYKRFGERKRMRKTYLKRRMAARNRVRIPKQKNDAKRKKEETAVQKSTSSESQEQNSSKRKTNKLDKGHKKNSNTSTNHDSSQSTTAPSKLLQTQTPPIVQPPAESPTVIQPPAESPTVVQPPAESPTVVQPPAESPTVVQPPVEAPPPTPIISTPVSPVQSPIEPQPPTIPQPPTPDLPPQSPTVPQSPIIPSPPPTPPPIISTPVPPVKSPTPPPPQNPYLTRRQKKNLRRKLKRNENAKAKAREEARLKAEEEARLKAEEEARLNAEEEARRKIEQDRLDHETQKQKNSGWFTDDTRNSFLDRENDLLKDTVPPITNVKLPSLQNPIPTRPKMPEPFESWKFTESPTEIKTGESLNGISPYSQPKNGTHRSSYFGSNSNSNRQSQPPIDSIIPPARQKQTSTIPVPVPRFPSIHPDPAHNPWIEDEQRTSVPNGAPPIETKSTYAKPETQASTTTGKPRNVTNNPWGRLPLSQSTTDSNATVPPKPPAKTSFDPYNSWDIPSSTLPQPLKNTNSAVPPKPPAKTSSTTDKKPFDFDLWDSNSPTTPPPLPVDKNTKINKPPPPPPPPQPINRPRFPPSTNLYSGPSSKNQQNLGLKFNWNETTPSGRITELGSTSKLEPHKPQKKSEEPVPRKLRFHATNVTPSIQEIFE